jgi:hypothetical protein
MGESSGNNTGAWRAALAGMACGALATVLLYLYFQVRHPTPYNALLFGYAPVLMVFGGMAGLVYSAMRDSGRR